MTAGPRSVPALPAPVIIGVAALAALITGRLFADGHVALALALVLAAAYVPLVFLDFPLALALWVGLLYIAHVEALTFTPRAIALLLVIGWVAIMAGRAVRPALLGEHRRLMVGLMLFVLWLGLARIWSLDPGFSEVELSFWSGPLVLVIVATTMRSPDRVRLIVMALVAGAAVSVLLGVLGGPLANSGASAGTIAEGRFTGGGGDPNTQAAGYLAAAFLAAGLLTVVRGPRARIALVATLVLVTYGLFATQSRGGLIGLVVAAGFALAMTPRYRGRILALIGAAGAVLAGFLSSNPQALQRLTAADAGTGREDLWTVAWRIFLDHPVLGIGLGSFRDVSPRYVLESGELTHVRLIAESPHLVHNIYLELLVENGIVGLALFVFVAVACLSSGWLAARRFDAAARPGDANLARAVIAATVGVLTAAFFVSNLNDFRMWVLLALGPVMLTIARNARSDPPRTTRLDPMTPRAAPGSSSTSRP